MTTRSSSGTVRVTHRSAKGSRVVGDQRRELRELLRRRYEAGESIRSLASDTGRSYGFVMTLLAEAGVRLRRRGGDTRGRAAVARRAETRAAVVALRERLAGG